MLRLLSNPLRSFWLVCFGCGLLLAALLFSGCAAQLPVAALEPTPINNLDAPPQPSPDLSPADVVRIQVAAMQNNDIPAPDSGIRTAFGFASPSNRRVTGPVERFIDLVKNPQYRDLVNAESATYSEPVFENGNATIEVSVINADSKLVRYRFVLSRQEDWPFEDCWMTDAVMRIPERPLDTDIS
ncbi:MAG: DUF4864 domain-containing protein [Chloroflexaceae bacterium]|nr:DUF4864 domain-containing protein [Chloroflexaceae bacterium]NJL33362.1 DUF4864 domain-containing protein [Chloroflexaceae bacterium]NJO07413.1 DUF4864 domain-containing protein [Chloroflexaceae bacterium]